MSPNERSSIQVALATLNPEHLQYLQRALSNLFSTSLAFETYAQVVDGQPINAVWDEYGSRRRLDLDRNIKPSREAQQVVEAFRSKWNIQAINIDARVAQAYQDAPLKSQAFKLRLIELVAVISHDVAASLFEDAKGGLQQPDLNYFEKPGLDLPDLKIELPVLNFRPWPTLLYHADYEDYEDYPRGVADIVGYWAEWRLFGGVVLFDRGSGTEVRGQPKDTMDPRLQCKNVFIHPMRRYRIYQLSETQIQQLVDFLLSEQPSESPAILPIRAEKYARRIDPYDAMGLGIYRDKYERKIPLTRPVDCVVRGEDFPELVDAQQEFDRQWRQQWRR